MIKKTYSLGFYVLALGTAVLFFGSCPNPHLTKAFAQDAPAEGGAAGEAAWAGVAAGSVPGASRFVSAAVYGGSVYAVGFQHGASPFDYGGTATSVTGGYTGLNAVLVKYNAAGTAQWGRSVTGGSISDSEFLAVAVDGAGNVYAAGYQTGTAIYYYGYVPSSGTSSSKNAVLVKYNSEGAALWAMSVGVGSSSDSEFNALAVDGVGNVYAAGFFANSCNFGGGLMSGDSISNAVLVKYSPTGVFQWAKSVTAPPNASQFLGVAVSDGFVYAAGYQDGTGPFDYGGGAASVQGNFSGENAVLVKYDLDGTAEWGRSVDPAPGLSRFTGIAASGGFIYAGGYQYGNGSFNYGGGATSVQGGYASGTNAVLVKYDSGGTALWGSTGSSSSDWSRFNGVTADSLGFVYAGGYQYGNTSFTYGGSVSVVSTFSGGENAVLVKYRPGGTASWARSVTAGNAVSIFEGLAASGSTVYAAGTIDGAGNPYNFGGSDVSGGFSGGPNAVLVQYR